MKYRMTEKVFFVKGAKNAIIYDLRNTYAILHWLDLEAKLFLDNLLKVSDFTAKSDDERKVVNFLVEHKLVEPLSEVSLGKIETQRNTCYKINFAWIEVTSKCNYRCKHCYGEFGSTKGMSISDSDFLLVLNELRKLEVKRVQLIGGEPLIIGYKRISGFIEKAVNRGFEIEIFTNGYFINNQYLELFKKDNIRLSLSVYGPSNIHKKITGHSRSFIALIKAIELLEKHKIKYRLANTIMVDNEAIEESEIAKELNVSQEKIKSDILRLTGRGTIKLLSPKLIKKKLIDEGYFRTNRIKSEYIAKNMRAHNCFSNRIYISQDLTVYPCVMERRFNYGNLKEDGIDKLLDNSLQYICFNKDKVEICKNCEYRYACFDCRPDSITGKQFNTKPWYCPYDPNTGIWMDKTEYTIYLTNKGENYANCNFN